MRSQVNHVVNSTLVTGRSGTFVYMVHSTFVPLHRVTMSIKIETSKRENIMIMTQPEAKSQLLCTRCGHSEDDHNWSTGPCTEKVWENGVVVTHCICYAFVSPLVTL